MLASSSSPPKDGVKTGLSCTLKFKADVIIESCMRSRESKCPENNHMSLFKIAQGRKAYICSTSSSKETVCIACKLLTARISCRMQQQWEAGPCRLHGHRRLQCCRIEKTSVEFGTGPTRFRVRYFTSAQRLPH